MKHLLLSILLVFVVANAYGQSPTEVKTNDGRVVILKPDGTWEYKKDTPQPSPSPASTPVKQSIGTDSLPPNFAGHDMETLSTQLHDLKKRLVKSEFETTAEYEKRAAQEKQKTILGNFTVQDTFSLVIPNAEASYDADSQKMQFFLPVEKSRLVELYRSAREKSQLAELYRSARIGGDLEQVNLYNIQWKNSGTYGRQGIFFDDMSNLPLTKKSYQQGFLAEIHLGVEEARRLKNMSKAVAIVQFEEPYVGGGRIVGTQLQVRLIDVYFFDPQTGRILAKMSQSGK
jgi:hypothetical protein